MKSAIFISIIVLTAGYSPAWSGESPKTSTAAVVYSHRTLWTLQETTRIALRQNPDLLTALDNIQAAEDVIGQSVSGYLPHIEGAAGVQRSTLPQPSAGSTALLGEPSPYASAALAVQQTVFDFGQALEHIRSEVSRERAAKEELYAFQNVVTLGVEKAFYDVALTKDLVAVAKRAEAEFRETQRDTTLLVDTGVRPPFDLSQANVELETAKLSLIKAQNSHDLAKVALLNIMGMHDRVDFEIEASTQIPGISTKKMDLDWIIGQGLQLRPEMRRDTLEVRAAKQALRSEVASLLPSGFKSWFLIWRMKSTASQTPVKSSPAIASLRVDPSPMLMKTASKSLRSFSTGMSLPTSLPNLTSTPKAKMRRISSKETFFAILYSAMP